MKSLEGQTALVTGALGGLGAEIATALAAAGAGVAVHHLNQHDAAREFAAHLQSSGGRAHPVAADVTDWDQVAAMVKEIETELGDIDILVNNAGYMAAESFLESDDTIWRRTIDVDLTGVFIVSRLVAPGMVARGSGAIINMSSQLALKGAHHYVSYCAAKAGVLGLTKALAREIGPAVRVNAVAPGPIDTPFIADVKTQAWVSERTRDSVIGRLGNPDEVAPSVIFLAGPGAALLHGQTLHLNGGGVMM